MIGRQSVTPSVRRRIVAGLLLGAVAAVLFAALASIRLDAQGPHYDELHQAAGAFVHLGRPCPLFCIAEVGGYPLLNMPYSAAIKTHLYGLWMRFVEPHFDVVHWRWAGIGVAAATIAIFAGAAAPTLGMFGTAALLALIVTDVNLVLLVRHDFGPVVLALVLRLALMGCWLASERDGTPRPRSAFAIGALAGLAAVEKLSSVVLVPVALLFVVARRSRPDAPRHFAAGFAGLAVGVLPLAIVNVGSFVVARELVSLRNIRGAADPFLPAVGEIAAQLALGQGARVREAMLGVATDPGRVGTEVALVAAALTFAGVIGFRHRGERTLRLAGLAAVAWGLVVFGLGALPLRTSTHHWVIGAPFAALALALVLAGARRDGRRFATAVATLLVVGLLAVRTPTVLATMTALREGRATQHWHPELAALGHLAAADADSALFVATSWGVATQIHCLSDGRAVVLEAFWPDHPELDLAAELVATGRGTLYLVRLRGTGPALARALADELAADPRWQEVAPPAASNDWRAVELRAFRRTPE